MIAQSRYLFEARQDDNTSPIQYAQPQSLHRQYQRIAASNQVQSDAKVKQLLQSFEICPFLDIRSLMTALVFSKMKHYHDEVSNILEEQYMVIPKARQMDEQYQRVLDELRHEEMCYSRLIQVVGKYNQKVQTVDQGMNQCVKRWKGMRNQDIMRDFRDKFDQYKTLNRKFKEVQTAYFQLKSYRQWIVKAANQIFKRNRFQNIPINNRIHLQTRLKELFDELTKQIDRIQEKRFNLRNKIKYGNQAAADFEKIDVTAAQFFSRSAYGMLHSIGLVTSQDEQNLRKVYQNFRESYKLYLRQYKNYEHINLLMRLEPEYSRVVAAQQQKLTNHLKKHHELMVPYQTSDSFNQIIENLKDTIYEPQQYIKQLRDFQQAQVFLNKTYPRLFKEVCQGKSGNSVNNEIANNARMLRNGLPIGYNTILEQSLARLQHLNIKR